MDINTSVKLNNDLQMPILGLGTWQSPQGNKTVQAVKDALEIGYRHLDTAAIYGNEESVGKGLHESGIQKDNIFVTTKLWNNAHKNPAGALDRSLEHLNISYVDLYLIHWPVPERIESWKVLEQLYKDGKAKAIGVSNFTVKHLQELIAATDIVPAVNQVEHSPYLYQKELHEFCKSKGIQLEAYSPLTRGEKIW